MLRPRFIPESVFYTQSVMLSPRFIPESSFYTQSVVRSPQSLFYTDRDKLCQRTIKRLSKHRNDDPAGVRWINSDLIGFTHRMKKIEAEVDTT